MINAWIQMYLKEEPRGLGGGLDVCFVRAGGTGWQLGVWVDILSPLQFIR